MSPKTPVVAPQPLFILPYTAIAARMRLRSPGALGHQRGAVSCSKRDKAENRNLRLFSAPRLIGLEGMTLGTRVKMLLVDTGVLKGRLSSSAAYAT